MNPPWEYDREDEVYATDETPKPARYTVMGSDIIGDTEPREIAQRDDLVDARAVMESELADTSGVPIVWVVDNETGREVPSPREAEPC